MKARVASIEYPHGGMVLHLDNGQVWEQVQEPDAELNLRAGDSVTIDKILGAYWLGGRSSGTVKVRQKQ